MRQEPRGARLTDTPRVRVLLLDHDRLFRSGFRQLLEDDGIEVAGDDAPYAEALDLVRRVEPDVVAVNPAVEGGEDLIRSLATEALGCHVLAIADSAEPDDVIDALDAGASGYVTKTASQAELTAAVRTIAAGGSAFSRSPAATLVECARPEGDGGQEPGPENALSEREVDVLRLVAEGKDNAEIARELSISPETVKNHISKVLAKLGVDNRIQAAVYAVRSKLV